MLISDWSSDVCSSDLIFDKAIDRLHAEGRYRVFIDIMRNKGSYPNARCFHGHNGPKPITVWCSNDYLAMGQHPKVIAAMEEALHDVGAGRSAEHTSELQSLMRISYAVFCLKIKNHTNIIRQQNRRIY